MNKRFYSIKAKNPKLISGFFLLCFTLIFQNSLVAQTTLYSESMDNNTGAVPTPNSILNHETNGNFDQVGLTYSGTGDMRSTLPSSGYGTASGGFNAFLNSTGETFIIDGLDLTSCITNIVISF